MMCRPRETVELDETFTALWRGRDPFAEVEKLEGEIFRNVKNRRTFRFEIGGKGYFAKVHRGVGWREIFKNLLQLKRPVLGASNEFHALGALRQAGVATMTPAAFGRRGRNPARQFSFLITRELENTVSLEDAARKGVRPETRRLLIKKVAESAGKMHRAGINHCDCYICHYLIPAGEVTAETPVYVIDLHRARQRKKVPRHFHVKDVAGLHFSSMDAGLSRRDRLRFVAAYCRFMPACRSDRAFWESVDRAAKKLYLKEHGRAAGEEKNL